ncbi:restriction endonuclease [Tumebacillus algifaecis]|uniref:restriction endonuclease n=1 Tax=Tumebacillus algifaecis TaxID=1214604 RepID=UPI00223D7049
METSYYVIGGLIVLSILLERASKKKKRKGKRSNSNRNVAPKVKATSSPSTEVRADSVILQTPLQELSGFEFERLLALYFRDQGYKVEETGVGGNDGGVDLVLIDRRGSVRRFRLSGMRIIIRYQYKLCANWWELSAIIIVSSPF